MSPSPTPTPEALPAAEATRPALRAVAACGGALTLAALLWGGLHAGFSAALGAAVAVANLFVLGRVVGALLGDGSQAASWSLVGLFKLVALFFGMWALFSSGVALVLPFMVGYGALPIGITLGSLFVPTSTSSTEAKGS